MKSRGLLDLRGKISSKIKILGNKIDFKQLKWSLNSSWIPTAELENKEYNLKIEILCPIGQKGFAYSISVINKSLSKLKFEVEFYGKLDSMYHCINEESFFEGNYSVNKSSWSDGPVFSVSKGFPVINMAPMGSEDLKWKWEENLPFNWTGTKHIELLTGENKTISLFWGFGYEEVSSLTQAKHLKRVGIESLRSEAENYLSKIIIKTKNKDFDMLVNRNKLFAFYYSTGLTIDTEERVSVTSRSPEYYVSAAYWDRDSLLWAFPAILLCDVKVARQILHYIATTQKRNVGVHSRFIDGTILEPGFELDELCSPIIAIDSYIKKVQDSSILLDKEIETLIIRIIEILEEEKEEKSGLYETFLQPTDDTIKYPYLTYNNVLVWKNYKILECWNFQNEKTKWKNLAEQTKLAINKNCIKEIENFKQYVWSVDTQGNFELYDEPPGSLMLLPVFGFCSKEDKTYINTCNRINDPAYLYSFSNNLFGAIGCAHAPHPWILSLANSIRVNHDESSINKLLNSNMDGKIACESIDENTGECTTGKAFATCAGYLASVLHQERKKYE